MTKRFHIWNAIVIFVLFIVMAVIVKYSKSTSVPKSKYKMNIGDLQFHAGDLLLTHRRNPLMTSFGGSFWTHIAIVYEDPYSGVLYAWDILMPQSRSLTGFLETPTRCTRLITLERFIERWKGTVALRKLEAKTSIDNYRFSDFIKSHWNSGFAYDFITHGGNRFFEYLFNIPVQVRTEESPRYCAELAAETYKHLGVFQSYPNNTSFIPRDFSEFTEKLPLNTKLYKFGPEIIVMCNPKQVYFKTDKTIR